MKILLTGASGFVGSHILDSLRSRDLPAVVLVRPETNRRFLEPHLPKIELRQGDLRSSKSLRQAVEGITHIIHCAGCTKALRTQDFHDGNQIATRNVLLAIPQIGSTLERFLLISSLAAAGPSNPGQPRRETDPDNPISAYGKSKLAAEKEVKALCPGNHVILRPSAVYGPRDTEFLRLFKAVRNRLLPATNQLLSLVYVKDLAEAAVECLFKPAAVRRRWFVASPEPVTARQVGEQVAAEMRIRSLPLPLPNALLWLVCAGSQLASRFTGKATMLNLLKYPELTAPAWLCDATPMRQELGLNCATTLSTGLRQTLAWYQENRWL